MNLEERKQASAQPTGRGDDGKPVQTLILPDDTYNRALVHNVHPPTWVNPTPSGRYNLVVLGAGTAGLVSAVGAAGLGAKVAIVERHLMGGDCLNFGCVPSKGVIRAARAIHAARHASVFGARVSAELDFGAAMLRMRRIRSTISHNDSAHRLTELGVCHRRSPWVPKSAASPEPGLHGVPDRAAGNSAMSASAG